MCVISIQDGIHLKRDVPKQHVICLAGRVRDKLKVGLDMGSTLCISWKLGQTQPRSDVICKRRHVILVVCRSSNMTCRLSEGCRLVFIGVDSTSSHVKLHNLRLSVDRCGSQTLLTVDCT